MTTPTPENRLNVFLAAVGGALRHSGRELVFRCPCHANHRNGDTNPSGNVCIGDDGRLLMTCRAGCATEDMVAAIGWTMADLMPPGNRLRSGRPPQEGKTYGSAEAVARVLARSRGKLIEFYVYRAQGRDVGLVARVLSPEGRKEMPQARCVSGLWTRGGMAKPIPLFLRDQLLSARADLPVQIHEGEQKALLATKLGFVAVSCAMGAGKAAHTDLSPLAGRVLHVFPDNDPRGQDHARDVARRAYAAGATEVWLVTLPDLPEKGDIVDFCSARREAGLDDEQIADEIRDAITKATMVMAVEDASDATAASADDDPSSIADQLVAIAADAVLFHDANDVPYASIQVEEHREVWRIGSEHFERWLRSRYYRTFGKAVPPAPMTTAIGQLSAMAQFDGERHPVHLRIAHVDGAHWIDLANENWQAVAITADGWRVVGNPPVRFTRRPGMKALPTPTTGIADLSPMFDLLHFDDPELRLLVTAWLVTCLLGGTSYPILALTGEQGSGKSTFSRALHRLADPHALEGRSPPRGEEDLAVAAQNAHVLSYENLSGISASLSDAMCRVATGAAFAARKLYTDADERQLIFCKPILLNGIDDLATRSDLADRMITIQMPPIPGGRRRTESELWAEFEQMQPQLLGSLLNLMAGVLGMQDIDVPLERMAEYSRLGAKVAVVLGLDAAAFSTAYRRNRDAASMTALESSAIGPVLLRVVRSGPFKGPTNGLMQTLTSKANDYERRHTDWPNTPRALGDQLRRLSPNLARIGITVDFLGRRRDGYWVAITEVSGGDVHNVHDVHTAMEAL